MIISQSELTITADQSSYIGNYDIVVTLTDGELETEYSLKVTIKK